RTGESPKDRADMQWLSRTRSSASDVPPCNCLKVNGNDVQTEYPATPTAAGRTQRRWASGLCHPQPGRAWHTAQRASRRNICARTCGSPVARASSELKVGQCDQAMTEAASAAGYFAKNECRYLAQ